MPPVPRYTSAAAYPPATSFSGTAKSRPWSRALEAQCCPARNWWEFTARMWWWLINTRLICLWVRCCRQKVLPANQALKARCWGGVGLRCGWVGREALSSVLLALFFFLTGPLSPRPPFLFMACNSILKTAPCVPANVDSWWLTLVKTHAHTEKNTLPPRFSAVSPSTQPSVSFFQFLSTFLSTL